MQKIRGFEVVKNKKSNGDATLPTRADPGSAGYDFYAPKDYICEPHKNRSR